MSNNRGNDYETRIMISRIFKKQNSEMALQLTVALTIVGGLIGSIKGIRSGARATAGLEDARVLSQSKNIPGSPFLRKAGLRTAYGVSGFFKGGIIGGTVGIATGAALLYIMNEQTDESLGLKSKR